MCLAFVENCETIDDAEQAAGNVECRTRRRDTDVKRAGYEQDAANNAGIRQVFVDRSGKPHTDVCPGSVFQVAKMAELGQQNSVNCHSIPTLKIE